MKKILIALDYNPSAVKIAKVGYAMAKANNAEVILMHVVADPVYYSNLDYSPIMGYSGFGSPEMLSMINLEEVKNASRGFLEQSKKHLGDESITLLVGEGDCADAILKAVDDLKVDTIVMGTHSRRGLDKILMGSIAEKVLHHSTVPMLIIPTRTEK